MHAAAARRRCNRGSREPATLLESSAIAVQRDVAQSGSAPEWGSGGRGFKSRRPDSVSDSFLGSYGERPRVFLVAV